MNNILCGGEIGKRASQSRRFALNLLRLVVRLHPAQRKINIT